MSVGQVKRGYANPGFVERRRAEIATEEREQKAALLTDASVEARYATAELTAGIVEEAGASMPFADSTGPSGLDVAGENMADMDTVMGMAIGASSAAHAARAATREPELPSHHVLVQAAVEEILSPSSAGDETWTVEDDQPEESEDTNEENAQDNAELVDWLASVAEMENEAQEDEYEWAEVEDEDEGA
jgi:hypothetical protein